MEIAEGITLTGQYIIRLAEKKTNEYLNKLFKTDNKDYCVLSDTDSIIIKLDEMIKRFGQKMSLDEKIDFLDKVCEKIQADSLDKTFDLVFETTNGLIKRVNTKREFIASRGISCCLPDTRINTDNGVFSIESLYNMASYSKEENVRIDGKTKTLSANENLPIIEEDTIMQIIRRKYTGDVYTITYDDKCVTVTEDHLVYVQREDDYEWVKAKELTEYDTVLTI